MLRPGHARGAQPQADRPRQLSALRAFGLCGREPRARGDRSGPHPLRREHDDRLARAAPPPRPSAALLGGVRSRSWLVRARDAPSPGARRRSAPARGDDRRPDPSRRRGAAPLSAPSPHAATGRRRRPRPARRGHGAPLHAGARLQRVPGARGRVPASSSPTRAASRRRPRRSASRASRSGSRPSAR